MFRLRENRLTGTVPEELLASGKLGTSPPSLAATFWIIAILLYAFLTVNTFLRFFFFFFYSECFDASSNLMDNFIPQGICPSSSSSTAVGDSLFIFTVICNDLNDPTCSCCTCGIGEEDYCSNF
jgi:hypothetical protein